MGAPKENSQKHPGNQRIRARQLIPENLSAEKYKTKQLQPVEVCKSRFPKMKELTSWDENHIFSIENQWFHSLKKTAVPRSPDPVCYCLLVVWALDFQGSRSEPLSKKLTPGISRFRDPFSAPVWSSFCKMLAKTSTLQITPGTERFESFQRCDVIWRRSPTGGTSFWIRDVWDTLLAVRTKSVASRPCRARCI